MDPFGISRKYKPSPIFVRLWVALVGALVSTNFTPEKIFSFSYDYNSIQLAQLVVMRQERLSQKMC